LNRRDTRPGFGLPANTLVLGALMLAACTGLNGTPRDDGGAAPFDAASDAPFDAPSDGGLGGAAGAAGQAGLGGGGHAGAAAGGVGGTRASGGAGGATNSGGRGGTAGGHGGQGGHAGASAGVGGATASCPATTTSPCTPNAIDTAEQACCSTGKQTRTRKCDPVTCQWGSYGAWSSCSVAAACTPGATSACTNNDPCGNRVCSSACAWGDCVPKSGNACLCIRDGHTDCGSNYRCGTGSHAGDWQFCLSDTCQWSTEWAACSSSNCEC